MLESSATNDHVSCCGEVNQPHSVIGCVVVEAELSDCWTKYVFLTHLGVEVTKHDFYVMTGAALVCVFKALVKTFFDLIIFFFCRSVRTL